MWVYIFTEDKDDDDGGMVYEVGYYSPDSEWHGVDHQYTTKAGAARRVHFLNGGVYHKENET